MPVGLATKETQSSKRPNLRQQRQDERAFITKM